MSLVRAYYTDRTDDSRTQIYKQTSWFTIPNNITYAEWGYFVNNHYKYGCYYYYMLLLVLLLHLLLHYSLKYWTPLFDGALGCRCKIGLPSIASSAGTYRHCDRHHHRPLPFSNLQMWHHLAPQWQWQSLHFVYWTNCAKCQITIMNYRWRIAFDALTHSHIQARHTHVYTAPENVQQYYCYYCHWRATERTHMRHMRHNKYVVRIFYVLYRLPIYYLLCLNISHILYYDSIYEYTLHRQIIYFA